MRQFTKNLVIYFHNLHRPDKPGVIMHIMMKCLETFSAYGLLNGIIRFTKSITLCHMGAMVFRIIGNSTDCSATSLGKQIRRQNVHITGPLLGESTNHLQLVFPQPRNSNVESSIEIIQKFIPQEQAIFEGLFFFMHMRPWTSKNSFIFVGG